MTEVREGLSRAQLVPAGTAWADLQGGWERAIGAYGRAELGYRPTPPLAVYAFGQLSQRQTMAGAGVRVTW